MGSIIFGETGLRAMPSYARRCDRRAALTPVLRDNPSETRATIRMRFYVAASDLHTGSPAIGKDIGVVRVGGHQTPALPGPASCAAQEAVEAHFHGETEAVPGPSAPEAWEGHEDFQGGFWMMVDIDLSKVNTKAVRLNISLPENLVHRIDAVAKAQRLSRSAFLAKAAEREMAEA